MAQYNGGSINGRGIMLSHLVDSKPWTQQGNRFSLGIVFFVCSALSHDICDAETLIRPFLAAIQSWRSEASRTQTSEVLCWPKVERCQSKHSEGDFNLIFSGLNKISSFVEIVNDETERFLTCTLHKIFNKVPKLSGRRNFGATSQVMLYAFRRERCLTTWAAETLAVSDTDVAAFQCLD